MGESRCIYPAMKRALKQLSYLLDGVRLYVPAFIKFLGPFPDPSLGYRAAKDRHLASLEALTRLPDRGTKIPEIGIYHPCETAVVLACEISCPQSWVNAEIERMHQSRNRKQD